MASFGNNEFSRLGRYKLADNQKFIGGNFAPFVPAFSGTGAGTTSATPGNGYTYQTFTASGTLLVEQPVTADILVVGGGGAGGNNGTGGGAGGLVFVPGYSLSAGTYVISIGAGAGAASSVTGNPSFIMDGTGTNYVTARGGGCGQESPTQAATPGGSGGGGSGPVSVAGTAIQPTYPQGIPAPSYLQYGNPGGGPGSYGSGGGAGAAGGVAPYGGVSGGVGRQYPDFAGSSIGLPPVTPLAGYYAGGGGGAGGFSPYTGAGGPGPGGLGGGGKGTWLPGPRFQPSSAGQANSGGGGGGGSAPLAPAGGEAKGGGSGIVIVRYQVSP